MKLKDQEVALVTSSLSPLPHRILLLALEEDKTTKSGLILADSGNMLMSPYTLNGESWLIPISMSVARVIKLGSEVPEAYKELEGKLVLVRTGDAYDMVVARSPETKQEWFTLNPEQIEMVVD